MKLFEYKHIVKFNETSIVGNVYFAHYFHWQGNCREEFLRRYASGIIKEIANGLVLVTTDSSCNFYKELFAFDEVLIEMSLTLLRKRRCRMAFRFFRMTSAGKELVAEGEQGVVCVRKTKNGDGRPEPFPSELYMALASYKESLRQKKQAELD